jgi:hypothetical protein
MPSNTDICNRADKLSQLLLETESGCWEFIGGRTGSGYGAYTEGRTYYKGAHVVAFELENGAVPDGMFVLHKCDNPPCCRPDHLFLGDHQTNKDDEVAKGRNVYGERVGNHKLTEDDVRHIRQLLAAGESLSAIGRKFNVTHASIYYIKISRNWGWL